MRILEAEVQLMADLTEEIEVVATHSSPTVDVVAGRHPTLGRLVLIREKAGANGLIVEAE